MIIQATGTNHDFFQAGPVPNISVDAAMAQNGRL
jgi:hypothetical protein